MATQDWFIMTEAERDAALAFPKLPPINAEIGPMEVTGISPGAGMNLNPDASGYDAGDPVTLSGKWLQTRRTIYDPLHTQDLKDYLLTLPWASLDSDTVFAPVE